MSWDDQPTYHVHERPTITGGKKITIEPGLPPSTQTALFVLGVIGAVILGGAFLLVVGILYVVGQVGVATGVIKPEPPPPWQVSLSANDAQISGKGQMKTRQLLCQDAFSLNPVVKCLEFTFATIINHGKKTTSYSNNFVNAQRGT